MLSRNAFLHNRYRIVRPLSKGGFGQVYEALDDKLDCIVAVKERLADLSSEKLRRAFEREAKLLANMRHPSLPKVTDHFFEGQGQYLVMEFIEGDDLAKLLSKRQHPFAIEQVLDWADELLKALEYLHSHDEPIIHRDIKPANVKLTNEGEIFLLDFGLAKGYAGEMSVPGTGQRSSSVYGYTAAYAPLEQLNKSGTNEQSDVYSLGATLYHLVTGRLPLTASLRYKSTEMGQRDPLPAAYEVNPAVPEPLSRVLSQALALYRRDRLKSASQMRRALAEARRAISEADTKPQSEEGPASPRSECHPTVPPLTAPSPTAPAATAPSPGMEPTLPADQRSHLYRAKGGELTAPEQRPEQTPQFKDEPSWSSHFDSQAGASFWASTVLDSESPEEAPPSGDGEKSGAKEREEFEKRGPGGELERRRREAAVEEAEKARLREQEEHRHLLAEQARLRAEEVERLKRQAEEEEKRLAEEAAKVKAQEVLRLKVEEEAGQAEEARLRAEEEAARLRVEEEARHEREQEARRQAARAARLKAQEEEGLKQRAREEEATRRKTVEEEEWRQAEARRRAEAEEREPETEAHKAEPGNARRPAESGTEPTTEAAPPTLPAFEEGQATPLSGGDDANGSLSRSAVGPEIYKPFDESNSKAASAPPASRKRVIIASLLALVVLVGAILLMRYIRKPGDLNTTSPVIESANGQVQASAPVPAPPAPLAPHKLSLKQTLGNQKGTIWSVAYSPDGSLAASGGDAKSVSVWDISTWQLKNNLEGHQKTVNYVAFSPDGQLLASASSDKTVRLWKVSDGSAFRTLIGHTSKVLFVAFSPDGQKVASSGGDGIKLWDVKTGKEEATLTGHGNAVWCLAFAPDGKALVAAEKDKAIQVWDLGSRGQVKRLLALGVIFLAFSPDGAVLATAHHNDNTIKLWDLVNGRVVNTLKGHTGYVSSLVFTKDGKVLASASKDQYIKLWDVKSGKLLQTLPKGDGSVETLSFSPDAKTLVSGGRDQSIKIWQ